MFIDRFEEEIDPVILSRGKQYFAEGLVHDLLCDDENVYFAWVEGSSPYEVEVRLSQSGEVLKMTCDCPYDWGGPCKHCVAMLYAIREERKRNADIVKSKPQTKKTDLRALLLSQTKESLANELFSIAERDRMLRRSLLLRFGNPGDEIEQSRKLVRESMRSKDGYWEYGQTGTALKGAWVVLERALGCVDTDCERAVRLSLVVLPEAVRLLSYCDDSNGEVGEVIAECAIVIKEVMETGWQALDKQRREAMFHLVLEEALSDAYVGMNDFRLDLFQALLFCCTDDTLRQNFYQTLARLRTSSEGGYNDYYENMLVKLQLKILERWGSADEAERFLMENLSVSDFRKQAIDLLMDRKEYAVALTLALDGIEKDAKYAGLVHDWRIAAYKIYEAMGNWEKVLELAEYFVLHERDGFAYYPVVKNAFPPDAWPNKLETMLSIFEKHRYPNDVYEKILLEEGCFDRLLDYCKVHNELLPRLAGAFPVEYRESVEALYSALILELAASAYGRSDYQKISGLLRSLGKDVSARCMIQLKEKIKAMYPRKRALQDELGKF